MVLIALSICPLAFETLTGDSTIVVSDALLMLTAFFNNTISAPWSDLRVSGIPLYPEFSILLLNHSTDDSVGPLDSTDMAHRPIFALSYATNIASIPSSDSSGTMEQ